MHGTYIPPPIIWASPCWPCMSQLGIALPLPALSIAHDRGSWLPCPRDRSCSPRGPAGWSPGPGGWSPRAAPEVQGSLGPRSHCPPNGSRDRRGRSRRLQDRPRGDPETGPGDPGRDRSRGSRGRSRGSRDRPRGPRLGPAPGTNRTVAGQKKSRGRTVAAPGSPRRQPPFRISNVQTCRSRV